MGIDLADIDCHLVVHVYFFFRVQTVCDAVSQRNLT